MRVLPRWGVLTSLVIVGWLATSSIVAGQTVIEVLDQSQTAYYAGGGPSINAAQSVGQVFTAGISGDLSTIRVMVGRCEEPTDAGEPVAVGDMIIELQTVNPATGLPTDVVLSSIIVAGQTLPGPTLTETGWVAFTDASWTTVSFSTPVMLQRGSQYALVFRAATPGECNFYTTTGGANPLLGGHLAWRTDAGWTRVTWAPAELTEDVAFQTYVIPADPLVLVTMLHTVVDEWAVANGSTHGFAAKLIAVEKSIAAGRITSACNQLHAFDAMVAAKQGKALTADQARQVLAITDEVRARLDC